MEDPQKNYDSVDAYDFDLPRELIAQHPAQHRIDARLLLVDRNANTLEHHYVRDLPDLLNPGDALVLNDSKVIPARLLGSRTATRGRWEGLFLRADENGAWEVLSKTRGHLTVGETLTLLDREGRACEALQVLAKLDEGHLAVRPLTDNLPGAPIDGDQSTAAITELMLERFGRIPLPPYIRDGQMVDDDINDYQTVYAKHPGSVAAPTAGLHFTVDLIKHLQNKGVRTTPVTLHVGIGTFRPVSAKRLSDHKMHTEVGELPESSSKHMLASKQAGSRVIAVGTTSMRVLESAALQTGNPLEPWKGETDIFIRPPFEFQAVDSLMTNFHLPKSTLLALVAAFAGYDLTMRAYQEAIEQRYRFFSYGDCMMII